jgi:hypothetical protein
MDHADPTAASVLVVGKRFDIVDALLQAGNEDVALLCTEGAVRCAFEKAPGSRTVIVDARRSLDSLHALARAGHGLDGAIVVVWGGTLGPEERALLHGAHTVVWCSERMPASTLASLARRQVEMELAFHPYPM